MQSTNIKLHSLTYSDKRSYAAIAAFVAGNVILPQLCHLVPQGGFILLPIYFFTLIAAYKFGWRVGLATALLSPLVNHLLFGMPPLSVLPLILIKSTLLALSASYIAHRTQRVSIALIALTVALYQLLGTLAEWTILGDQYAAMQDMRMGIPGMMIQIFGGYFLLRASSK